MLTHPEKGLFFFVASGLPVSEQKNESLVCKNSQAALTRN